MFLMPGDKAYLKLHKGYLIPANLSAKRVLGQQYVGPFNVIQKVGSQAYRLLLPAHWKVHPVFTIAMLEPAPAGDDPFGRPTPDHPGSVFVEGDTPTKQSFVVESLINRRVIKKGRGKVVQYLVRWQGYGPEDDRWYSMKDLDNAKGLVAQYDRANGVAR